MTIEECLHMLAHQVAWVRAARTDKGVSALANVVSLRANLPRGDEQGLVRSLNGHLPPDVRCFDVMCTTKVQNGKMAKWHSYNILKSCATPPPHVFFYP